MYISKVYLYFGKFGEEMKIMSHLNNKSRFRESWFSVILLNYKNDYSIIQFKIIRYNENKNQYSLISLKLTSFVIKTLALSNSAKLYQLHYNIINNLKSSAIKNYCQLFHMCAKKACGNTCTLNCPKCEAFHPAHC